MRAATPAFCLPLSAPARSGGYFRENFAQGGIDLVQIVPELVTNADAAIAASGSRAGAHRPACRRGRPGVHGGPAA